MYAKLSNGAIMPAPNNITVTFANPTPEQYEFCGYKPVKMTEQPEYDHETQRAVSTYEYAGNEIVQVWAVEDIPVEEIVEDVVDEVETDSVPSDERLRIALEAVLGERLDMIDDCIAEMSVILSEMMEG